MKTYENLAHCFTESIKSIANNPDALGNFESYLIYHFPVWLEKYASTPEDITAEMHYFSTMFNEEAVTEC